MSDGYRNEPTDALETGMWWVNAGCPQCGEMSIIPLNVQSVATFPEDGTPSLGLKCKSLKVDRDGSQGEL